MTGPTVGIVTAQHTGSPIKSNRPARIQTRHPWPRTNHLREIALRSFVALAHKKYRPVPRQRLQAGVVGHFQIIIHPVKPQHGLSVQGLSDEPRRLLRIRLQGDMPVRTLIVPSAHRLPRASAYSSIRRQLQPQTVHHCQRRRQRPGRRQGDRRRNRPPTAVINRRRRQHMHARRRNPHRYREWRLGRLGQFLPVDEKFHHRHHSILIRRRCRKSQRRRHRQIPARHRTGHAHCR